MDVGRDGRRLHHTGPVVVTEHQRPLEAALGQYHLPDPHAPEPLPRARGSFAQVAPLPSTTLRNRQEVMVVVAEHGAAGQQRAVGATAQFGHDAGGPLRSRLAIDAVGASQQAAAELVLFVGENYACAGPRRRQRRHQAGRSAAGHQHVAVGIHVFVGVGIGLPRRSAEAGRCADQALVEFPPGARVHERLVVEAGAQHSSKDIIHCADIELHTGPALGSTRHQPVVEFHLRRQEVRLCGGAFAHLHDRVGLLRAAADDPAGAAQLEAASHQGHAVGDQRGGKSVPLESPKVPAVKGEGQGPGTVDPSALLQSIRLRDGHRQPPFPMREVVSDSAVSLLAVPGPVPGSGAAPSSV